MLDGQGNLSLKVQNVTNSNGICWNADATIMYYIDTPTKKILSYYFENKSGKIAESSLVVDTNEIGYESSPDGMTIDSVGNLWVAFCHGGCVVCFDPRSGDQLHKVDLPCVETTACAFGGPNLDRLFVTTGLHKTLTEPEAGRVFVIDGLGVQGVPAFGYLGQ